MKTPAYAALLSAALLFAAVPEATAAVEAQTRGRAALVPPVASPQPDATGFVEVRSRASGERFQVEVYSVDPLVALEVFVEDGDGTLVSAGLLGTGAAERILVLDTGAGDSLPAGATAVADLVGRVVEVREADSDVILAGAVPALTAYEDERPTYGRSALMRNPGTDDPKSYGSIRLWARPSSDEIRIAARKLDGATAYEVFIEDEAGVMVSVGTEETSHPGSLSFDIDTRDGDALPVAAWSVHDMAGRRVEVREVGGDTELFGRIPPATRSALKLRGKATIQDDDSNGRVSIDARVDYRAGRDRLRVDLARFDGGPGQVELFLDDGTGTMVSVASEDLRHSGKARFQWDNRKGDSLPFEVECLTELSGRAFEIRVDGVIVLTSNLPNL